MTEYQFNVDVSVRLFIYVEADTREEAEVKAREKAWRLEDSSNDPIVHDITDIELYDSWGKED